jgi:hypothetical protein
MRKSKMGTVIGNLWWNYRKARGDYLRPRGVPADVWKRMSQEQRERMLRGSHPSHQV